MPLQIDAPAKLIKVLSPQTDVSAQELHDFVENYMASPVGMANDSGDNSFFGDILKPEGKIEDPSNPAVFSQIILIINSEWQIQFWQGSGYTRLFGGKIVGGVNDQPFKATGAAGDITVLESPVDGLTVASGSGALLPAEKTQLSNIDARTARHEKIINNLKEIKKVASSWYLIIYDDGEVSGGTEILRKKLTDHLGADISDLTAGVLSAELESTA